MKHLLTALIGFAAASASAQSAAAIDQTGTRHVAEVTQTAAHNLAQVTQLSETHYAFLIQSGGSSATVLQRGGAAGDRDNCVLLDQADGATAQISQTGAHNTVWGTGSVIGTPMVLDYARSDASTLAVDQSGWSNVLFLDQVGSSAAVAQDGRHNSSWIAQR